DAEIIGSEAQPHEMLETVSWPTKISTRDQISAIDALRDLGISDGAINEAFHPDKHTMKPEIIDLLLRFQSDKFGDREWVQRLLSGGAREGRELVLMEIALATARKQTGAEP